MVQENFKKLSENQMMLAELEQRRYIRENLKGTDYFFKRIGLEIDDQINELMVETTSYGFNKKELDEKITQKNASMELYAIEQGLSQEYYNDDPHSEAIQRNANAKKGLGEILELMNFGKNHTSSQDEEKPLTEHEQVLKKIDELKVSNMSSYEKERHAMETLSDEINSFFN